MEENKRMAINHVTALQGEQPHAIEVSPVPAPDVIEVAGVQHRVRALSMESLSALEMIGSPFAAPFTAALNGKPGEKPELSPTDVVLYVWVHAEEPDRVLEVASKCAPGYADPAKLAALQFVRGWSVDDMFRVVSLSGRDLEAVQAAAFDCRAPELGGSRTKKNSCEDASCPC